MPVSKYITREEFEAKHGENIEHFNVLAEGLSSAILVAKENQHELKALKSEMVEVKGILSSVGFNGSSELVKEFLTYAPELIREGRELRKERALWEAHDLIGKDRRRKWGQYGAWWATPRRVAIAVLSLGGVIGSIVVAVFTIVKGHA